jgi:hypothetical protein
MCIKLYSYIHTSSYLYVYLYIRMYINADTNVSIYIYAYVKVYDSWKNVIVLFQPIQLLAFAS